MQCFRKGETDAGNTITVTENTGYEIPVLSSLHTEESTETPNVYESIDDVYLHPPTFRGD